MSFLYINDENKPANIPDYATIIKQCFKLGPEQATAINISGVRITIDKTSEGDTSDIWVKFGPNVTMGEAMTQQFVAQYLQANNHEVRAPHVYLAFTWGAFGYIVSEFIDGRMCNNSDTALIAAAVQTLISIPSPSSKPGRVGGGLIEHPFFIDRQSSIEYESVKELEDHVNGILSVTGRKGRVRFCDEVAKYGLRLCVSDLNLVNFMRDKGDKLVAVDFGGYSFLPPSFFTLVLRYGCGALADELFSMLEYPPCQDGARALVSASCALAPFNSNDIGVPKGLRSRLS